MLPFFITKMEHLLKLWEQGEQLQAMQTSGLYTFGFSFGLA
jgi:hypothetical protein